MGYEVEPEEGALDHSSKAEELGTRIMMDIDEDWMTANRYLCLEE